MITTAYDSATLYDTIMRYDGVVITAGNRAHRLLGVGRMSEASGAGRTSSAYGAGRSHQDP